MKTKFFKFVYIIFATIIIALPFASIKVNAQTPTATASSSLEDKINDLKNKVASRVAELNLVEKRGIIGTVSDISNTQITLSDINDNTRFVDVDELTKFSSPSAKTSFGISDIEKGAKLGVLGLYNKSSRRILARFVDVLPLMQYVHGAISSIDKTNFVLTVQTVDNKTFNIDIENATKTFSFTTTDGLIKAGFSKIVTGESLVVSGYPDKKDPNTIIASRIILLPSLPKNPGINLPIQTSTGKVVSPSTGQVVSTGSGKTLTPIVR